MRAVLRSTAGFVIVLVVAGCGDDDRNDATSAADAASPAAEDSAYAAYMRGCMEPLFTDQQRIATNGEVRYGGGLMCAVPAADLTDLTYTSYRTAPKLVAYVDVQGPDTDYYARGFRSGRNCLYIGPRGQDPDAFNELKAMVTYQSSESPCDPVPADAHDMDLDHGGEGSSDDIPPVVRIDMNQPSGRTVIIGLRCLPTVWCEISRDGGDPPKNPPEHKKRFIAGWYDEQYLGTVDNGELKPSALYASIYPHDLLPQLLDSKDYNDWRPVAVVRFRSPSNASSRRALRFYRDSMWGLKRYPAEIQVSDSVIMQMKFATVAPDTTFIARYVVNNFTGDSLVVTVPEHSAERMGGLSANARSRMEIGVPATRWGWSETGETPWVRCSAGCCSVTGDEVPVPVQAKPEA